MTLAIDFDDTIHDTHNVRPGYKMGVPMPGAVAAMQELAKTHTLIIHTIWANSPEKTKAIADWLTYFKIPYQRITNQKPEADVYLDDKGLHFTSWEKALTDIQERA